MEKNNIWLIAEPITIDKLLSKKKKFNITVEDIESNIGCFKLKLKRIKRNLIIKPSKNIPNTTPLYEKLA